MIAPVANMTRPPVVPAPKPEKSARAVFGSSEQDDSRKKLVAVPHNVDQRLQKALDNTADHNRSSDSYPVSISIYRTTWSLSTAPDQVQPIEPYLPIHFFSQNGGKKHTKPLIESSAKSEAVLQEEIEVQEARIRFQAEKMRFQEAKMIHEGERLRLAELKVSVLRFFIPWLALLHTFAR